MPNLCFKRPSMHETKRIDVRMNPFPTPMTPVRPAMFAHFAVGPRRAMPCWAVVVPCWGEVLRTIRSGCWRPLMSVLGFTSPKKTNVEVGTHLLVIMYSTRRTGSISTLNLGLCVLERLKGSWRRSLVSCVLQEPKETFHMQAKRRALGRREPVSFGFAPPSLVVGWSPIEGSKVLSKVCYNKNPSIAEIGKTFPETRSKKPKLIRISFYASGWKGNNLLKEEQKSEKKERRKERRTERRKDGKK